MTTSDKPAHVTRRDFIAATGLAASGWIANALPPLVLSADAKAGRAPEASRPGPRWFETAWRRAVIDMHIPDWDPKFLSEFDPEEYVRALVTSRAQSVVCYAQSHVGLFNYPTKVGRQHAGLNGRDIVAELIERCHRHGIAVVLYVSVIHDRWAADQHPDWRMIHANGGPFGQGSRHGFVCPNSPYREYVRAWTRELAERFDCEGVRFDMTFWPGLCFCPHCQRRWREEEGGELPRTVDWTDERWVRFQRKREQWLGEFAEICTSTVKAARPQATVEHQASIFPLSWLHGASWPLVAQNDFLQGDFYGDALQGSFVRKLLEELTPRRPFGYETSFSINLHDHTARKSEALLEAKASAAIADGAAFIFIDAIDPVGTVNPHAHARMGRVFDRLMPHYAELGGERVADIGLYYSLDSRFDLRANGRSVLDVDAGADTHTRSTVQMARVLMTHHLPWRVVTRKSLGALGPLRTLVLSNVHHMTKDEAAAIRAWVRSGGTLYASGTTSLIQNTGRLQPDFMLGDVFGVSLVKADWGDRDHYVAPTDAGQADFADWDQKYPAYVRGPMMDARARPGATVLATRTLPWPAPDARSFSSIHSNPPWIATDQPEVVWNEFGSGRAIYSASALEEVETLHESVGRLLRRLCGAPTCEVVAHPAVEVTLFHQPDRRRYVLSLVNFQKDLPNSPLVNVPVTLRVTGRVGRVEWLPSGRRLSFRAGPDGARFVVPRLETLARVAIVPR
ncbi:MAG: beta-galactosidase [Verrucomicrobia bacterium]|nr:beta-galactosidase [Verrucomicrobiota bacterium]